MVTSAARFPDINPQRCSSRAARRRTSASCKVAIQLKNTDEDEYIRAPSLTLDH